MMQKSVNFEIHHAEPVNQVLQLLDTVVLDDEYTQDNIMTAQQHSVTTQDSYVQFGQLSIEQSFYQIS